MQKPAGLDSKEAIWEENIALLFNCVEAHRQMQTCEEKRKATKVGNQSDKRVKRALSYKNIILMGYIDSDVSSMCDLNDT